jgi:hypothetical protein
VSNKVKSILEKKAQKEAKAPKAEELRGEVAIEVDSTDVPTGLPQVGDFVFVAWGDPNLIGAPLLDLACLVTHAQENGRINGHLFFDPTSTGMDPRTGREIAMPATAPVANLPYNKTRRALTWRYRVDETDA